MADGLFSFALPSDAARVLPYALVVGAVVVLLAALGCRLSIRALQVRLLGAPGGKGQRSELPLHVVVEEHALDVANDAPLDVRALVAERPIGSGGQGGVWLAFDPTSGKKCALKQLRKGRLAALKRVSSVKPEACQWLIEREALIKCGSHPFITTCYATFQDDQSLFYALELASGGAPPPAPPPRHRARPGTCARDAPPARTQPAACSHARANISCAHAHPALAHFI